jgi:GAF domain-containing protein
MWQALFAEARRTRAAVTGMSEGENRRHLLALPVKLRYMPVGVLGFHRPASAGPWQADEIAAIETVADRLALAIDNTRLLDTAQRRAARERQISEITTRMRGTLDIESVLKTTADEMYQALGVEDVVIRLVPGGTDT